MSNSNGHLSPPLRSSLPLASRNDARRPYTRGWRAPWRGQWGTFADGHSRLARLAKRIERELRDAYVVEAAIEARRVRQASRLMALSEQTMQNLGSDPKATRRAATALERTAESILATLQRQQSQPAPTSGAELLERLAKERAR